MNDARYRYLVQRMLDEELPPEVSYAVKGYLDTSEQGSNFYQILKELLEAVEQLPLPEELKPEQPEILSVRIAERVSLRSPSFFRFVGRLFRRESKKIGNASKQSAAELTLISGGRSAAKTARDADDSQTITNRLRAIGRGRLDAQESESSGSSLRATLKREQPEKILEEAPKTLADAIRQKNREREIEATSGTFSASDNFSTSSTFSTTGEHSAVELLADPWEEFSFSSQSVVQTLDEVFCPPLTKQSVSTSSSESLTGATIQPAEPISTSNLAKEEPSEWTPRHQSQITSDKTDELESAWVADYRRDMAEIAPTTIIGTVFSDEKAINQWISDGASFADTKPLSFIDVDPTIVQQPLFNAVPQDLFGADYEKAMNSEAQSIFQSVPENLFGPQYDRAVRKAERAEEEKQAPRPIPVDAIMEQLGALFGELPPPVSQDASPRIVAVIPRLQNQTVAQAPEAVPLPVATQSACAPAQPQASLAPSDIVFDAPVIRQVARLKTTADDPNAPQGRIQSVGKFLLSDRSRERIATMLNQGALDHKLKVLTAEASSEISGVLKSLEEYDGVIGSVIVGYDGLTLASTLPASLDTELISAWALMSYISTCEVSNSIDYGRVYQIASRTSTGYVLLADFGQALLVTLCNSPTSDGLVPLMRRVMELTA